MDRDEIIEQTLNDLFTNGQGDKASRLVLTPDEGNNLGGWGKRALRAYLLGVYEAGQRAERERIADKVEDIQYSARSTGEFAVALRSLMEELKSDPAESGE